MHHYLAPYIGAGHSGYYVDQPAADVLLAQLRALRDVPEESRDYKAIVAISDTLIAMPRIPPDPFRPRGSEQPGWAAIDLRPDCTVLAGRAVLGVPVRDDTIGTYLGEDLRAKSAAIKIAVASRFGLTLEADTIPDILAELLIGHARTDGTRWKPLRAGHDRLLKIFLGPGPPIWQQPVIAGGVQTSDSFDRGDGDSLGANWIEVAGDWDIVSNTARLVTTSVDARCRNTNAMATADHYAQVSVLSSSHAAVAAPQVSVREGNAASETAYLHYLITSGGASEASVLYKFVAAVGTQLQSTAFAWAAATEYLIRIEASGSSISRSIDGTPVGTPVTDTSIPSNVYTQMRAYGEAGYQQFNDFQAGDLVEGHPAIKRFGGVPFAALNRGVW